MKQCSNKTIANNTGKFQYLKKLSKIDNIVLTKPMKSRTISIIEIIITPQKGGMFA